MLFKVAESLIRKLGAEEAETRLKENPLLWKEMIVKMQTPSMLSAFDVLANYQLELSLIHIYAIAPIARHKTESACRIALGIKEDRLSVEAIKAFESVRSVSYTHLDVYKRQCLYCIVCIFM